MHATASMWRSEANFLEFVLSSHCVSSRILTQVLRLGNTCLYALSQVSEPCSISECTRRWRKPYLAGRVDYAC